MPLRYASPLRRHYAAFRYAHHDYAAYIFYLFFMRAFAFFRFAILFFRYTLSLRFSPLSISHHIDLFFRLMSCRHNGRRRHFTDIFCQHCHITPCRYADFSCRYPDADVLSCR